MSRVQEIFQASLAFEEPDRSAYLDLQCAGDASLRIAVKALIDSVTVKFQGLRLRAPGDGAGRPERPVVATITVAVAGNGPTPPLGIRFHRGRTIGRYVVLDLVGQGGMGEVYAAYDPELDRKVAVKVLRWLLWLSPHGRERLLREAQAIAKLSHPNVVVVHDVGTVDDHVFIAMEFVAGRTVTAWLSEEKRSPREILEVFTAAGRGLEAAHRAGMMHRDFK